MQSLLNLSRERIFFGAFFLVVASLSLYILSPYIITIAIAAVLAVMAYPLYRYIYKYLPRSSLAAFITLLLVSIGVLLPLIVIGNMLVTEAKNVSSMLRPEGNSTFTINTIIAPLKERIVRLVPDAANINVDALLNEGVTWLSQQLGGIFANTAGVAVSLFVGLIALYYFIKDGEQFASAITRMSPLSNVHDQEILTKLSLAINSVVTGTMLVALIQGTMVGIGFSIFGIANPILWGTVAAVTALIPGIGTAIIIAPAVLYLFFIGSTTMSIGLLVWGMFLVGLVDNMLGPRLIGRGIPVHPLFMLLSVLGGLSVLGASGFILGPLVLSVLVTLGHIYMSNISGETIVIEH